MGAQRHRRSTWASFVEGELGLSIQYLNRLLRKYEQDDEAEPDAKESTVHPGEAEGDSPDGRITELEAQIAELKEENEGLQSRSCH